METKQFYDVLIFIKEVKNLNFLHLVVFFPVTPLLGSNKLHSNKMNGINSGKAAGRVWINLP